MEPRPLARFNEPFESPRGPLTCGRDADERCPGTGRRLNFSEIHEPAEFKDWVRRRGTRVVVSKLAVFNCVLSSGECAYAHVGNVSDGFGSA